jgi:hypothetical protein
MQREYRRFAFQGWGEGVEEVPVRVAGVEE